MRKWWLDGKPMVLCMGSSIPTSTFSAELFLPLHKRITYGYCSASVLDLTIDYGESPTLSARFNSVTSFPTGPFAFMDVFDPFHICNHTDESGRYAYKVLTFSYDVS